MKLIRLSSDKKGFHSIDFKDGINLIVGRKKDYSDKNTKNTYNGVGKSLAVYLIHFCLGSNRIAAFEENIPDWNFYLEIDIDSTHYKIRRNTSSQNDIFINDEKYTLKQFRDKMLKLNFSITENIKNLSFNTLFPRFIRRDRESYNSYDNFIAKEQDYSRLLNNSFLLGLNIDLIQEKKKIREFQISTENLKNSLEKDSVLKEHFSHKNDTEIEINDLTENIIYLEKELDSFRIANNYNDIEIEADKLARDVKKLSNERTLIENDISNILKTLEMKTEISAEKVISFYKNVKIEVPEMVNRKLNESINFHNSLLEKRNLRLQKELRLCRDELKNIKSKISDKGLLLDKNLEYLDTHGALDEFSSLNKMLNEQRSKLNKLLEYQEIMKTYKKKLLEIKSEYSEKSLETQEYIDHNSKMLNNIKLIFRELTKEFYDKGSGIKIESNDGENTLRYNIDVRIQDDSSDGVNEVKILCYDLMILLLQANHKIKFVFHDSRLFSNMDPRQRGTVFKLVNKKIISNGYQYIATVNEDQLDSFKDSYTVEEFHNIIEENTILDLTDESDDSKLLGIQIDMKYEKS